MGWFDRIFGAPTPQRIAAKAIMDRYNSLPPANPFRDPRGLMATTQQGPILLEPAHRHRLDGVTVVGHDHDYFLLANRPGEGVAGGFLPKNTGEAFALSQQQTWTGPYRSFHIGTEVIGYGSHETLIFAPSMAVREAGEGGQETILLPRDKIDVTGRYGVIDYKVYDYDLPGDRGGSIPVAKPDGHWYHVEIENDGKAVITPEGTEEHVNLPAGGRHGPWPIGDVQHFPMCLKTGHEVDFFPVGVN